MYGAVFLKDCYLCNGTIQIWHVSQYRVATCQQPIVQEKWHLIYREYLYTFYNSLKVLGFLLLFL